jgi:hypothetical protein
MCGIQRNNPTALRRRITIIRTYVDAPSLQRRCDAAISTVHAGTRGLLDGTGQLTSY